MIVYLPDFASLPVHHFCLAVIMISKNYDDVLMFVPDVIPCYTLVPTDRIPSHPLFFRGVSLPGGLRIGWTADSGFSQGLLDRLSRNSQLLIVDARAAPRHKGF